MQHASLYVSAEFQTKATRSVVDRSKVVVGSGHNAITISRPSNVVDGCRMTELRSGGCRIRREDPCSIVPGVRGEECARSIETRFPYDVRMVVGTKQLI